jgi:hypothetical protein
MTPTRDPRNPADTYSTPRDDKRAEAEFSLNPPNAPDVPRRETAAGAGEGAGEGAGAGEGEGASGHEPTAIHIDAWLNAFARLLNLPAERRREIVAELEAHLTERVRDLMIDGHAEAPATQQAIRELGDAAVIASRFHKAERTHPRRWIMNTLILSVSAAAISLSTLALRQAAVAPPSHAPNSPPAQSSTLSAQSTTPESLSSLNPDFATTTTAPEPTLTVRAGETAAEFFDDFAKSFGVAPLVRWDQLESAKVQRDAAIPVGCALPRPEAWKFVQDQLTGSFELGWRLRADQIEISVQSELDRREIELVSYDLTSVINEYPPNETSVIIQNTMELINQTIEPEYWRNNGGDLASIHRVGRKVFVRAPKRVHEGVRWILAELERPGDAAGSAMRRPHPSIPPADGSHPAAFHDALTRDRLLNLTGLVENPGNYLMPDGPLTLRRLIEVGGGLKPGAASIRIERRLDSGDIGTFARMTATDLSSKSTATDPVLAAGDVIIVE